MAQGHGRLEISTYSGCKDLPEKVLSEWRGAKTALKVERRREVKVSVEVVYGITSLDLTRVSLKKMASYWRVAHRE